MSPALRSIDRIEPDAVDGFADRPLAVSGLNLTLVASPNTAAATARQVSTSMPVQLPLSSGLEKPGSPVVTPHCR